MNVPQNLLQKWERDAFNQGITARDFPEYLRGREMMWRESRYKKPKSKSYLEMLEEMNPVTRCIHNLRVDFLILSESENHGELWRDKVERWYNRLKEIMMRNNLRKSDLTAHGLSWGACAKLYHAAIAVR